MFYDSLDLNFDICSPEWDLLNVLTPPKYPSLFEGTARLAYFFIRSMRKVNPFIPKDRHLFLIGTRNQETALRKVIAKTKNSKVLTFHTYSSLEGSHLPEFWFYLGGVLALPLSLLLLRNGTTLQRRSMIRRMERLAVSGPSELVWKLFFILWVPRSITVSNDHNHWTRSAVRAANSMGIQTNYIPHSITSESFPPLEAATSFLDSVSQASKYRNAGSQVYITGAVRFEDRIDVSQGLASKGLLICYNTEDKLEFIEYMLKSLPKETSWSYFVKPHPADSARFHKIQSLCQSNSINYVEPRESVFNLRKKVSIVLAGISGVHIDSLMCGLIPVSLKNWYRSDYYGLISDGILLLVDEVKDVFEIPESRFDMCMDRRSHFNEHLKQLDVLPSDIISGFLNKNTSNAR